MKNFIVTITYHEDIRAKNEEEAKEIAWTKLNTSEHVEIIADEYVEEFDND